MVTDDVKLLPPATVLPVLKKKHPADCREPSLAGGLMDSNAHLLCRNLSQATRLKRQSAPAFKIYTIFQPLRVYDCGETVETLDFKIFSAVIIFSGRCHSPVVTAALPNLETKLN